MAVILTIMVVLCVPSQSAHAAVQSSSVPTVMWDLYVTNQMSSQGILTDWANRRGHYPYTAYINGYKLYSNYYFKPQNPYRFVLRADEMYQVNQSYTVGMQSISNVNSYHIWPIGPYTHQFTVDCFAAGIQISGNAYFYIDGTATGASVSIQGEMTTY